MSFRHTYVTEFLYRFDKEEDLEKIKNALEKYGTVKFEKSGGRDYYGYFHGVIKDLDSYSTKEEESKIVRELSNLDCKIKIVFE